MYVICFVKIQLTKERGIVLKVPRILPNPTQQTNQPFTPSAMTTSSEDVLLQMSGVRYKKGDGTLYVMNERIAWMLENRDKVMVSHKYQDIKCKKKHIGRCKYSLRTDFFSAKDLSGRKAQGSATGCAARWNQHDVPFCQ